MKVKITYSLMSYGEIINLETLGYEKQTKWSDLSEEEQNEIKDSLRKQKTLLVDVEDFE